VNALGALVIRSGSILTALPMHVYAGNAVQYGYVVIGGASPPRRRELVEMPPPMTASRSGTVPSHESDRDPPPISLRIAISRSSLRRDTLKLASPDAIPPPGRRH